ncbi:hypothetical protein RMN57_18730 [Kitasatospora sp. CM 4170]|uniref:Uncharacterized protein n=1 Tax=Kitasatospora aburaviensis TaxID=67265 RepID=A0ABW1FAK2_9ACTN|nr:hypothetical protein [Kitasatospora sp. CM 4170]WNM46596.1 hypothetical protein RMN57_18730 [Kitasatospora sp. CM 4170]
MTHNDVARRTARQMPARSLYPHVPACEAAPVPFTEVAQRAIARALPLRKLHRSSEGGR